MPFPHRFVLVDIGEAGRHSDGETLSNSSFGQALDNKLLSIPKPSLLPNTTEPTLLYVIVGDEAFPKVQHDASLPRTIFTRYSKFITNSLLIVIFIL